MSDGCFVAWSFWLEPVSGFLRRWRWASCNRTVAAVFQHVAGNASRRTPVQHRRHATASPQITAKAMRFGDFRQQQGNLLSLGGGQSWRSTGGLPRCQAMFALIADQFQPLIYRALGQTERCGNVSLFPALLLQVPSPSPTNLTPIRGLDGAHGANHYQKLTTAPLAIFARVSSKHSGSLPWYQPGTTNAASQNEITPHNPHRRQRHRFRHDAKTAGETRVAFCQHVGTWHHPSELALSLRHSAHRLSSGPEFPPCYR